MMARIISPHSLSGNPKTAHSFTRSCCKRDASISNAETLYPPVLIISTDCRPRMRKYPSEYSTASPVLNHPLTNSFFVASGLFQYSLNTFAPLTKSSPFADSPSKRGTSWSLSWSFSLTSTPGKGFPTNPARRADSGCKGFVRHMPISVIPYRSNKVCPVMRFQYSNTGGGNAADPLTMRRRFEHDFRSTSFSFLSLRES
mmetsp:Transcript_8324/g.30745  ORF Transcript_8324/g.30745 Transcript_8324/m.30745 type:complete len:200 (-) Transcript_8324:931-1530(-)